MRAWTLIEMIGVLALVAVLAGILLPAVVGHIDKVVAEQEVSTLKSFGGAFQQYVLATRVIPDQTTWYSAIASKVGFDTNDVLYNFRRQPRVLLIDGALQIGLPPPAASGLPYSQTNPLYIVNAIVPTPMLPINPRVMIVSSLGKSLPNTFPGSPGGVWNATYFSDLWNAADGSVPNDAAWTGWTGNPRDVLVQRINLTPLFVHVLLSKYNSSTYGYFTIDGNDGITPPTQVSWVDGYFIQGTVLTLYTNNPSDQIHAIDTKQILTADTSFVFEQGIWRSTLTGAAFGTGATGVGDLVQQFLNATTNVNAANPNGNAQQVLVASNMLSYMSNYNVWALQYSYTNDSLKSYLAGDKTIIGIEPSMMSSIQGLYSLGTPSYYPTNPIPCP